MKTLGHNSLLSFLVTSALKIVPTSLIHTEFLQEYRQHGQDAIKLYHDPFLGRVLHKSMAQYQADIQYLYSILNQAFRGNGGASLHTQNHKRMQGGIKVWIDALDAYGHGGNMETR